MDDIWDEGSSVESKKMRQKRTEAFSGVSFDVMVNAEVYSAGASLLTRDFKYARRYGYWFRQLGAPRIRCEIRVGGLRWWVQDSIGLALWLSFC